MRGSVAAPEFDAFLPLDPGSGKGFFRIPDLGSQTHIFDSLMTNFKVKSTISLVFWLEKFSYPVQNIKLFTIL
jgi:hypothetical protein